MDSYFKKMAMILVLACLIQAVLGSSYNHYKLPESIRPEHYTLEIITHLENPEDLRFEGTSAITFNVLEDTNNITLHASNLTIDQTKIVISKDGEKMNCIKDVEVNSKQEYYIMHLCEPLTKSKYLIVMPFNAILNKNLHGYYRSSYIDKATKEKRWLSITQFEPTSARLAFPCFDEPEMKANFTIMLGHEKKYSAISNMPLKETMEMENQPGWIWSKFQESIPMSTYLVAYSVNDFKYKESMVKLKNDVLFRTWSRSDAISQVSYAAEVGPRVLEYYEDIFDIKFPLPKVDEIAIPDFSSGAMENWGLVTYRETALLYERNVSSASSKHRIASVISHELAHQWFGNLVTMKWWTDLWLNEGFATYVASLGVEHLHPEWSSLTEESVDNTLHIFKIDALKSSHPVSTTIGDASEIYQIFDSISYEKGSCVIRMMHLFMGDETFRKGITNYLKEHSYGNAEQDNLWAALTESAHKTRTIPEDYSIKQIMDSWTLQTGYPVITVTRDYTNGTASVSQVRYLLDSQTSRSSYESCWWVPLSYTSKSELDFETKTPKQWLECENKKSVPKVIENMPGPDDWVIFNIQLSGLYRVKYDTKNWEMLIETLMSPDFEKIHAMNRAQLIDDALDLAWAGDQDYEIAMRLVEYLAQERDYIPWKSAIDNLSGVNKILRQSPEYEFFKKYMQKILEPIYEHLNGLNTTNVSSDRLDAIKHKVMIAAWACKFEVSDCIPRAQAYFTKWQSSENPDKNNPVPLDLRSVVYCTSIRNGKEDEWQFLWQRYRNSNVASEKQTILSALGCSREQKILEKYLDMSFHEDSDIKKQDSYVAFGSVARGEVGFPLARDFFIKNIQMIYNYYNPETNRLGRLFGPLAGQMSTDGEFRTMKEFADTNKALFTKASQSVGRSLELIEINAQWRSKNFRNLSEKLKTYSKKV
ncbi:aminopeptidase N-like isoform X2 [Episyrphus balteatus]|uniref:aminopeptidase N-like isoform X2 n=1 Tax=Episyrphus balteatus TaxID=286459 RepID=UPI002486B0C3|nr:aminopeptidase N-like isoform X2 [Episyrphus balteatus]